MYSTNRLVKRTSSDCKLLRVVVISMPFLLNLFYLISIAEHVNVNDGLMSKSKF